MTTLVQKALSHVHSIYPSVTQVFFGIDGRWLYCGDDFEAPNFGSEINVDLLNDAADSVTTLPCGFTLSDEDETLNSRWENDAIQFPRLIAEIMATQSLTMSTLAESMDLDMDDLCHLFDRADAAWNKAKADMDQVTRGIQSTQTSPMEEVITSFESIGCMSDDAGACLIKKAGVTIVPDRQTVGNFCWWHADSSTCSDPFTSHDAAKKAAVEMVISHTKEFWGINDQRWRELSIEDRLELVGKAY